MTQPHVDAAYVVSIANTGETFRCWPDQTLLKGMEALGRRGIPVGCRGGGCGICKVEVNAGAVEASAMSSVHVTADELKHDLVLACRAYPRSDVSVRAVDRLARSLERRLTAQPTFLEAAAQSARTSGSTNSINQTK